jgi:predicted RNase H-like HicB family nuclease
MKRTYLVTLREAEEGGYTVEVPALPGCVSQGANYEDALLNVREAILAYLEEAEDDLNANARVLVTEVEVELPVLAAKKSRRG